jgi:hypothetical protein
MFFAKFEGRGPLGRHLQHFSAPPMKTQQRRLQEVFN